MLAALPGLPVRIASRPATVAAGAVRSGVVAAVVPVPTGDLVPHHIPHTSTVPVVIGAVIPSTVAVTTRHGAVPGPLVPHVPVPIVARQRALPGPHVTVPVVPR